MEGLSEALAEEVAPFGISVIIVEPGAFRTDFLGRSLTTAKTHLAEYEATAGQGRAYRDRNDGSQPGDPARGIAVLLKAIDAEQPPLRLPLGADAYGRIRTKLEQFGKDMAAWEAEATATGFGA